MTDEETARLVAEEMAAQMRLAAEDPGAYLATVLWHTAVGMQEGLGQSGIMLSGEDIISALAACATWALRDVPHPAAKARYTQQFLDVVKEAVEEDEIRRAKKQKKGLTQSELH